MIKKFVNIKYKEKNLFVKHLSKFYDTVNQLAAMKMMLDDELQLLLLLNLLFDSWKTLIISLNNLAPNDMVILKMIKDNILNEKIRRREHGMTI